MMEPGESLFLEYPAISIYPGENINEIYGEAHCEADLSVVVSDEDTATALVYQEEE